MCSVCVYGFSAVTSDLASANDADKTLVLEGRGKEGNLLTAVWLVVTVSKDYSACLNVLQTNCANSTLLLSVLPFYHQVTCASNVGL